MRPRSLFVKIYLTLIAALALVALTTAVAAFLGGFDPEDQFGTRLQRVATAIFPLEDDPARRQEMTERLADALEADITLVASDGTVLAQALSKTPPDPDETGHRWRHGNKRDFNAVLPDGRMIQASLRKGFRPPRGGAISLILIIAATIGVAAYPVVRHLTRRLEAVRGGMRAWGDGALSTRLDEAGGDEISAVAQTFNQAADRIEALIRAQKSLLANASHELRSPLARLRMAVEMRSGDGPDAIEQEILRNLSELDDLVGEILLSSRLDTDTAPAIDETVDLLAIAAEEAARLGFEAEGAAATIRGNHKLVRRLIRNLAENALRHGAPPVEIDVRPTGNRMVLTVRDHGAGIDESERGRIFEPFYRPSGHGEAAGGWGLGLALVAQIARLHNATIAVEAPSEGQGTVMRVSFPAA